MLTVVRKLSKVTRSLFKRTNFVRCFTTDNKLSECDAEEIKIPVPWGHIAGKWWGDKSIQPVVAIHGWQDNASTFDTLIPLLNLKSVLAIDLQGHGYSTHLPPGKIYDLFEYVITLERIRRQQHWSSLSLLTHSLGGLIGYSYSAFFPNRVDWLINIECARSLILIPRLYMADAMSKGMEIVLKLDEKKNVPAYKMSTMIKASILGSLGSVNTVEKIKYLLKRGAKPSDSPPPPKKPKNKKEKSKEQVSDLQALLFYETESVEKVSPDKKEFFEEIINSLIELQLKAIEVAKSVRLENDDQYFTFTRDPRTRAVIFQAGDEEFVIEAAKHIKCPVLSVRATLGFLIGTTRTIYEKTLETLKESSRHMEHYELPGTHHIHLNTPEKVAPVVNKFLENIKWKWWGSKNQRPILCVHGWQDNANTFDTLIPELCSEHSYLAIDLPGHGCSSHYPKGVFYLNVETVMTFRRIQNNFKWPKISIIGHSYGASCGFLLSSSYPDLVDFFIGIDIIKPLTSVSKSQVTCGGKNIEKMLCYDERDQSCAPLYTKEELLERWIKASGNSLTEESCEILMKRGADEVDGKYRLKRDCRIKAFVHNGVSQNEILKLADALKCNVLYIKAKGSAYFEDKTYVNDVLTVLKTKAKYYEQHELEGTHHLHLNDPTTVAPVINSFIKKIENKTPDC